MKRILFLIIFINFSPFLYSQPIFKLASNAIAFPIALNSQAYS